MSAPVSSQLCRPVVAVTMSLYPTSFLICETNDWVFIIGFTLFKGVSFSPGFLADSASDIVIQLELLYKSLDMMRYH